MLSKGFVLSCDLFSYEDEESTSSDMTVLDTEIGPEAEGVVITISADGANRRIELTLEESKALAEALQEIIERYN